jgi:hypothetical protein
LSSISNSIGRKNTKEDKLRKKEDESRGNGEERRGKLKEEEK